MSRDGDAKGADANLHELLPIEMSSLVRLSSSDWTTAWIC